ncbi:MAG: hypothetical protein QXG73_01555 [Candidatus Micrarchaeaceae archaeon]
MQQHRNYLPRKLRNFRAEYAQNVSLCVLNAATLMRNKRKNPVPLILAFLLGGNAKELAKGVRLQLMPAKSSYEIMINGQQAIILNEYERLLYGLLFNNWTVWEKNFQMPEAKLRRKVKNDCEKYLSTQIKINSGWGITAIRNLYILHLLENGVSKEQVRGLLGLRDYWFELPKQEDIINQLKAKSLPIRF